MSNIKYIFWLFVALLAIGVISGCVPHRPSMHHPHHMQNSTVESAMVVV